MGRSAWDEAEAEAHRAGVRLEPLTTLDQADRCLQVMEATWGLAQLMPREIVRALQASGNPPLGASADDELVGFVLGWLVPGEGKAHVHSHMLAVVPPWRSKGVGHALKLAQRAAALDAGISVIRWTFDPLIARNARFNLSRLGAVADRFHRSFYGEMTDVINRGDRSDRLEIRWDLDAPRRASPGGPADDVLPTDCDRPGEVRPPTGRRARVAIPADYPRLKEGDVELARAWRDAVADALEASMAAGMRAVGFEDGSYLLAADDVS